MTARFFGIELVALHPAEAHVPDDHAFQLNGSTLTVHTMTVKKRH